MDAKIIDICYHLLPCGTSLEYDYHMQGSTLHLPIMWTQWRIRECTAHDPLECSALNTFLQGSGGGGQDAEDDDADSCNCKGHGLSLQFGSHFTPFAFQIQRRSKEAA